MDFIYPTVVNFLNKVIQKSVSPIEQQSQAAILMVAVGVLGVWLMWTATAVITDTERHS